MTTPTCITDVRAISIPVDDQEAPAMFAFRDPDGNTFSITETGAEVSTA